MRATVRGLVGGAFNDDELKTLEERALHSATMTDVLAPLAISLVGMQQTFWGWNWCSGKSCSDALGALSWTSTLFPHVLAFPLAMTGLPPGGTMAAVLALDIGLCALVWRTQPPRLSARRLAVLLAIWIVLSVLTTLASPDLMVRAWHSTHHG